MVMILHASVNSVFTLVWPEMFPHLTNRDGTHVVLIASSAAALVLLAATRGKLGLRIADITPQHEQANPSLRQEQLVNDHARDGVDA